MVEIEIKLAFPGLDLSSFTQTSERTPDYNCIAWAAGEDDRKWWPDKMRQNHWPKGVPREETVSAFITAFSGLGYSLCSDSKLEPGFEKVAIFTSATGKPTHAARQLPDGMWTSKLGDEWDISHILEQVGGYRAKSYGNVSAVLRRPVKKPAE